MVKSTSPRNVQLKTVAKRNSGTETYNSGERNGVGKKYFEQGIIKIVQTKQDIKGKKRSVPPPVKLVLNQDGSSSPFSPSHSPEYSIKGLISKAKSSVANTPKPESKVATPKNKFKMKLKLVEPLKQIEPVESIPKSGITNKLEKRKSSLQ